MPTNTKLKRVFHGLVERIENAIIEGRLRPGERLPAERELGEMFGASRGTIREALRVLEQKGFIDIKTGPSGGAIVKPANTDCVSENLSILVRRRKVSLDNIAEFRLGVEGSVAALAAEKADEGDIRLLQVNVEEIKANLDAGVSRWREFIIAEERFHMTLAAIARNPVYQFVLEMIHNNLRDYHVRFPIGTLQCLQENYEDVVAITEAVKRSDAEAAKQLVQSHIRTFNRYLNIRTVEEAPKALDLKW